MRILLITQPCGHLLGVLLWMFPTGLMDAAQAQYSPNCLRNGRKDYCAITPKTPTDAAGQQQQSIDVLTFADHTVYELIRNEASCRQTSQSVRTCEARIITPPGSPRPIAAVYRGTAYEGGYKHDYVGKGIHLTYFFLD